MKRIKFVIILAFCFPSWLFAQLPDKPIEIFESRDSLLLYQAVQDSAWDALWKLEKNDISKFIENERGAKVISLPLMPIDLQERSYLFTLYGDSSYRKIVVKPLKSFRYGIFKDVKVPGLKSTQETLYLQEQLGLVKRYKEQGDLLFAGRLADFIIDHSVDSLLIGESLFELASIGDLLAEQLTLREEASGWMVGFYKYRAGQLHPSHWEVISPFRVNAELPYYRDLHLDVKYNRGYSLSFPMGSSYSSANRHIYQYLYDNYPGTEWAEYSLFRLINERPRNEWGLSPEKVIENALIFFEQYPGSRYSPEVYLFLGGAYSAMLRNGKYCQAEIPATLELKEKALNYKTLAYEAMNDKQSRKAQSFAEDIDRLKSGKCPLSTWGQKYWR